MSSTEKSRAFNDRAFSIDKEMDAAIKEIDWQRRKFAKKSLVNFVNTYLMGTLFEESPSQHMEEVMRSMELSLMDSKPF